MAARKRGAELERELRQQIDELKRERKSLRKAVYDFEHDLEEASHHTDVSFPFSLVNNAIAAGLDLLERAVAWLVRQLIR